MSITRNLYLALIAVISTLSAVAQTDPRVSGELKLWHKVNLTITGPTASETGSPNAFSDYGLNVTFTAPSGATKTVPGYFAADGNASETSAVSGNLWRAHLTPSETGTWTYAISFKQGTKVAINGGGVAVNAEDGATGSFTVAATDKTGVDFRAPAFGRLDYVGDHALRWLGGGGRFFKIGMNHPEVFLEFKDFDNADTAAVTTRDYSVHVANWNTGDPLWQTTKGKGILGVVNYLSTQGINEHYFLTMNSRGDGKKSFPWITSEAFWNYDVSKLAQWGIVFDHMMRMGVAAHFVLDECENQMIFEALEGTATGGIADSRKQYYREMAARFGYLNALTWNIGEENGWNQPSTPNGAGLAATTGQRKSRAAWLRSQLSAQAHIIVHNGPSNTDAIFTDLLGDAAYSGISYQGDLSNRSHGNGRIGFWHTASRTASKRWAIAYDEPYTGGQPTQTNFRKNALWASLLGGGSGVGIYSSSDLSRQDYTAYTTLYSDMRRASAFLNDNSIPYWDMVENNSIVSNTTSTSPAWCLSRTGTYVVYLADGGGVNLNAPTGTYSVHWFDPRNTTALIAGTNFVGDGTLKSLGSPPSSTTSDWALLVRALVAPVITSQPVSVTVPAGQTATFSVAVTGFPTPTLLWFKNGAAIPGQTSATLSLMNVQAADVAAYTVTATNSSAPTGVVSNAANLALTVVHPSYSTWATTFAGGQGATLDFDGDGVSNGIEYFMGETGTAPTTLPAVINTAGSLIWTWPYNPNAAATFKFRFSTDLIDWSTEVSPPHSSIQILAPVSPATLGSVRLTIPADGPRRFARLVVTPTP